MANAIPAFGLSVYGPSAHEMLPRIGELYPDDPNQAYQEKLRYIDSIEEWERDSSPGASGANVGAFTGKMRAGLKQPQQSAPGKSLLTSSKPKHRKRISGLGKDNTSGSDGTVAREQLSGE